MRHQKLHLVGQDAAVAQNKVFPQRGHIRRVKQRHARLLGRAVGFAVVASLAGGDHVHPSVLAVLAEGDDVFAGQVGFVEIVAAVSAQVAVAGEEFAVGQARFQIEGVDARHALGADDAVDDDFRLYAGDGVVAATVNRDFNTGFPAHLVCRVMGDGLFERNPGLGQPLGRQLQDLQHSPPMR